MGWLDFGLLDDVESIGGMLGMCIVALVLVVVGALMIAGIVKAPVGGFVQMGVGGLLIVAGIFLVMLATGAVVFYWW